MAAVVLRLGWFALGLTAALFALAGSFHGLARLSNDYTCLTYMSWYSGGQQILDSRVDLLRPHAARYNTTMLQVASVSPDGRYKAYVKPSADPALSQTEGTLYIQSSDTGLSVPLQDNIWLQGGWANIQVNWSPDSTHVGIWWRSARDNREYITLADAEHGSPHVLVAGAQTTSLYSWSPDNRYAVVSVPTPDGRVVSNFYHAPDFDRVVYTTQPAQSVGTWAWSPSSQRFIYGAYTDRGVVLSVVSLPEGSEARLRTPGDRWYNLYDLTAASNHWSADERFVAVPWYADGGDLHYDIAGADGTLYMDIAGPMWQPYYSPPQVAWQGHRFLFSAQHTAGSDGALIAFDVDSGKHRLLTAGLQEPPFFSAGGRHIAIYHRERDGRKAVELVRVTGERVPLVERADDASYPSWSPDGRHIAVIWATGHETRRVVRLTWANADGSHPQTLEDDFWDVRDLVWLDDGAKLAYVAVRRDGEGVEVIDMARGERQILLRDALKVRSIEQNMSGATFGFWWSTANGDALGDVFTLDGEHIRRLRAIAPKDFSWLKVFWSPDRTAAAIKLIRADGESLQLANADDSTIVVRAGLSGLGDPIWSPDSQRLTFTQSVNRAPVTLEVIDRHGRDLAHYDNMESLNQLAWSRCS